MHGCSQGSMHGCSQGSMHGCSQGGMHGCSGGHAWLLLEGCVWLLPGGHVWFLLGGCVVAPGRCAWQRGAYVAKGHVWQRGVCMVKGRGCAWQRGVCIAKDRHVWQRGACMAKGGSIVRGVCGMHTPPLPPRYGRSLHGRYASYWNAFFFMTYFHRTRGTMAPSAPPGSATGCSTKYTMFMNQSRRRFAATIE